ncbi:hypothetical protein [Cryobacterium sp. SO1]|uniref:hypothetical protein n=1 Tax=Cryobacterium sp. SO1 TaxID=1897061 RepID=UPI001022A771|nr:hypothetical protein [Cryobacterium sp. SO1]RZI34001.1 hypothetical protein BJQ95_03639 [Cryobacterium sp. SO1]
METRPIDPRDISWEQDDPAYRVYFWELYSAGYAPSSDEWQVTHADVHEVITWAEKERGDRGYELFVEHQERREERTGWAHTLGLIRLAGENPADRTSKTSPQEDSP